MKKIIFIFLILTQNLFSSDNFIGGVFIHPVSRYFDMDMDANNNKHPIEEEFIEDIIEVISGMIYGWEFYYEPSDIKREIKEIFTLKPIALIKIGDPNMHFRDNWEKNHIMYQNIVFYLKDFQIKRLKTWHSTRILSSSGSGESSIYLEDGKSISLKEALKNSIKKEFQSRGKDKPRKIGGQILLEENPRLFINSGRYSTTVEVKIIYKEIKEHIYN